MTGADTAGNVDAFLAEFHPDVRLDVQGYPAIMGWAAFDSVARPYFAARDVTAMTISPFATSVVSNDLALQGGSFVENFIEKKKRFTEYGRYAASIGRGQDGQWKIMYWMAIIDSTVAAR
jgi:hypothetical protein